MPTEPICATCMHRRSTVHLLLAWAAVLASVAGDISAVAAIVAILIH